MTHFEIRITDPEGKDSYVNDPKTQFKTTKCYATRDEAQGDIDRLEACGEFKNERYTIVERNESS